MRTLFYYISVFSFLVLACSSCKEERDDAYAFTLLTGDKTNLTFENTIEQTEALNIMNYMYFFNGGGVGAGDFNNDGKIDLIFSSNLGTNKIYLNEGNLKFKDVTALAKLDTISGWSTGISVVDINNDGMLDIYINQVSGFRKMKGQNRLMLCISVSDGIPKYEDRAHEYGLDAVGFSTQSTFFDYDGDGDLDMFLLNHSVHENGTFGERKNFVEKTHATAGDKLFRNDGGHFTDVTVEAGISSLVIGYGLGIATGDVNNDGWPDIYIGNDFHENDYLYVNQQDGTFKEVLQEQMAHTSKFSMGVDMADFNNDGLCDIFSLDMKPSDPFILKSSQGEDNYTISNFKQTYGYGAQFARNNLQLNNGDGTFSEIAMFARVHATDWSWAALFMDFNNDGNKDLFVSNGIVRRMNDIDYINFRENNEDHKWKTQANHMDNSDLVLLNNIPQIKLENRFFINNGTLRFNDLSGIKNEQKSFSNGAIYADLDNDGDLDIVTNNINDNPFVYQNLSHEHHSGNYLSFTFEGSEVNRNGIGAKVIVFEKEKHLTAENFPVRGFQSSMHTGIHLGIGDTTLVDSVYIIWPDRKFQVLKNIQFNKTHHIKYDSSLKPYLPPPSNSTSLLFDITAQTGIDYVHKENVFGEFDRESLIPFMLSTEGPGVATGDVNGDGLSDIFLGSAKRELSVVYLQQRNGAFKRSTQPLLEKDNMYEDVDALFEDIDNDGDVDLIVASGGNEFWGESQYLLQRYYLNDGKGNFTTRGVFANTYLNASCVAATDLDGDGRPEFFFGGRSTPKSYGVTPRSYFFKNTGDGNFQDITATIAPGLDTLGHITAAHFSDIDGDHDEDLIVAVEWGEIMAAVNEGKTFTLKPLTANKGFWNSVFPYDYDGDGDVDIIAGNSGLNSLFTASPEKPVRMFANDFDKNGTVEQLIIYYIDDTEVVLASHPDLMKQIPSLKKNFLKAKDFAKATTADLFGAEKLSQSYKFEVNTLDNGYFENLGGNKGFKFSPLPEKTQLSTLRASVAFQAADGKTARLFTGGNFFENNNEVGRFDADFGNELQIDATGRMFTTSQSSLEIKGQIRKMVPIRIRDKWCILVVRNNGSAIVLSDKK